MLVNRGWCWFRTVGKCGLVLARKGLIMLNSEYTIWTANNSKYGLMLFENGYYYDILYMNLWCLVNKELWRSWCFLNALQALLLHGSPGHGANQPAMIGESLAPVLDVVEPAMLGDSLPASFDSHGSWRILCAFAAVSPCNGAIKLYATDQGLVLLVWLFWGRTSESAVHHTHVTCEYTHV